MSAESDAVRATFPVVGGGNDRPLLQVRQPHEATATPRDRRTSVTERSIDGVSWNPDVGASLGADAVIIWEAELLQKPSGATVVFP